MKELPEASIDLTVTSPPYDDLRTYKGFTFDYQSVAHELYRLTKPGGIVVWVVGDATSKGSESGSSFRQALYFMDTGFKLHDTMIYEKNSSAFPAARTSKRYTQIFEYMFVFCKGKIRNDITLLCDKPNKWAGHTNWGNNTQYDKEGNLKQTNNIKPVPDFSLRNNIWKYSVGFNDKTGHPAVFPEELARDHILSWSNTGDVVLDPFMGSGTTAKMAMLNNRHYIGFDISEEYCEIARERISKYNNGANYGA
jgi:site-specific DNA-methyltransferase (adenine-specific)